MLGSPQVYREGDFSYCIYYNEGAEPPHVHVVHGEGTAKFWLEPPCLEWNKGLKRGTLQRARRQVEDRCLFFMEQWHATQDRKR